MNQGKLRQTALGPKSLAIVFLLATQVLLAAPGGRSEAKQIPIGPDSVVIVPFVFIGRVDADMTGDFLERLTSLKIKSRIVDDASFASHLGKGVNLRSDAPLASLLKAAKAVKAEVMILGQASNYKFLDAPGISLRVRVISVESGQELHRSVAKETSWKLSGAKSEAADTAAKQVFKHWRSQQVEPKASPAPNTRAGVR